jgi:hypothetical protein
MKLKYTPWTGDNETGKDSRNKTIINAGSVACMNYKEFEAQDKGAELIITFKSNQKECILTAYNERSKSRLRRVLSAWKRGFTTQGRN